LTDNVAIALVATPEEFDAVAKYVPLSPLLTFSKVSVEDVAPATTCQFLYH
jgi:hypothetical protein